MAYYIIIVLAGGIAVFLYFSATGNTKYVAETLAKGLGDTAEDLLERFDRRITARSIQSVRS